MVNIKPVKTEQDYDIAILRINQLLDLNPEPGSDEDNELDVLSTLVEVYEDEYFPILPPDPVETKINSSSKVESRGARPIRFLKPYRSKNQLIIVAFTVRFINIIIVNFLDKSMFIGNSTRLLARFIEIMRFGLSNSLL